MDRRTELADFLKSRRGRLSPAQAGVAVFGGSSRRVPGLRREELAQLAGVSVDYYVRLEQGRTLNVSEAVLDAVARALRLSEDEHAHLIRLARPRTRKRRPSPPQKVRPQLRHLLDAMTESAAFVVGRRTDVLAWNRLGAALVGGLAALPVRDRNFARLLFTDEAARSLFVDWPAKARDLVAFLRVEGGRHPGDPELAELVGELSLRSELFRRLWADHPVRDKGHAAVAVRHPIAGDLELFYEALLPSHDADQVLVTYTAAPGTPSADALRMLASLAATA